MGGVHGLQTLMGHSTTPIPAFPRGEGEVKLPFTKEEIICLGPLDYYCPLPSAITVKVFNAIDASVIIQPFTVAIRAA